jgi:hypothetical protein
MDQRRTRSDHPELQSPPALATQGEQPPSGLRVAPDRASGPVLSPDGAQRWDGSIWRYIQAESPRLPGDATHIPDIAQRCDGGESQATTGPSLESVAASVPNVYPVIVHWKLGTLTATPSSVAFDMTARSVLFGRHKSDIHREFAYVDLRLVEVHPGRASIGVVLRTREGETQGCQGCANADEVDAFLAALVQHDVDVLIGATTTSVMIGRYNG